MLQFCQKQNATAIKRLLLWIWPSWRQKKNKVINSTNQSFAYLFLSFLPISIFLVGIQKNICHTEETSTELSLKQKQNTIYILLHYFSLFLIYNNFLLKTELMGILMMTFLPNRPKYSYTLCSYWTNLAKTVVISA